MLQSDPTNRQSLDGLWAELSRDPLAVAEACTILAADRELTASEQVLHGHALALLDRDTEAAAALRAGLAIDPRQPAGWRLLGDLLRRLGDEAAAAQAALGLVTNAVHDPGLRRAAAALAANDLPMAERLLKPHLTQHPTDVPALRMLAELAGRLGRNAEAETLLRRALELAPGFAAVRHNLAIVLHRQHRSVEAATELETLLEQEPDHPGYRNLLGAVRGAVGDHAAAATEFEQALAARPAHVPIWLNYGHTLKTLGRQEDSVAAYRHALSLKPTLGEAWWSLANLKTVRAQAGDIAAMTTALTSPELSAEDRFHLHFALGKAYDADGAWADAFQHYAEGNRLRRAQLDFRVEELEELQARTAPLLTPAFFADRAEGGCASDAPIFVVGLPRSGSTLVEQILASHPLVEGTRELPDIQAIAHRLSGRRRRADPSRYPEVLAELSPSEGRALGEEYLARAAPHRRTGRPFFIDKMPNNWAHLALIRLILPNARVVDARRHPLACGWSNFTQHFARGQGFTYALSDLGRTWATYAAAMARVDWALPGWVHRVQHEAMVDDTQGQVRALLAALDLPFDPACLRFWETARAVQTASSEQVRRPIFRDGLARWRHYEPWLGELKVALGPALASAT